MSTPSQCSHELLKGDLCLVCLSTVSQDDLQSVKVIFSEGQSDLRLNIETASELDSSVKSRQLQSKKLSLVLDLDHTLLHATNSPGARALMENDKDIRSFTLYNSTHYVKLRPGLLNFLKTLESIFDLYIYTHGTREYAIEIAKIIDPDDSLFRQRIVARTDTPELAAKKSLKLLFPSCDDSMICILDDRIDVWHENAGNVILVSPYHYFKGMADVNNASGPTGGGGEEFGIQTNDKVDSHLTYAMKILQRVHEMFYAEQNVDQKDVKILLGKLQRSILSGKVLCFSGVFSSNIKKHSHPLYKMASTFGATIVSDIKSFDSASNSYLICHPTRGINTTKYKFACENDIPIVSPEWIVACTTQWQLLSSDDFVIGRESSVVAVDNNSITTTTMTKITAEDSTTKPTSVSSAPTTKTPNSILKKKQRSEKKRVQFAVEEKKPSTKAAAPASTNRSSSSDFLSSLTKVSDIRKKTENAVRVLKTSESEMQKKAKLVEKDDDSIFDRLMRMEERSEENVTSKAKSSVLKRKFTPTTETDALQEEMKKAVDNSDNDSSDDNELLDDLEQELFD